MTGTQRENLTVKQPPLLSFGPRLFPRGLLVFLALLFSDLAAQIWDAPAIELPLTKSEKPEAREERDGLNFDDVLSRIGDGGRVSEMTQAEDSEKSPSVTLDAINREHMFRFSQQQINRLIRGP